MNILIIGDSPKFFGGVTNYTRPLAEHLSYSNKVFYLFNSTRTNHNSFFKKREIYPIYQNEYPFECFELINGKSIYKNYNNLSNDYSNWLDKIFIRFIKERKIDVIHINEFFGFSTNIFDFIKDEKIKLVITVHEYWWLCPHRVMVDFNNKICAGPNDIKKCSFCVSKTRNKNTVEKELFINKFKNDFPILTKELLKLRPKQKIEDREAVLSFNDLNHENFDDGNLQNDLKRRLEKMIIALNKADIVIGVSQDVKRHLTKYGVKSDKIKVQHIGSTIAENNIAHTKKVVKDKIVFGFIGGVGYYKGVHQLVEAFSKLQEELKHKAYLKIYGKYDENYLQAIENNFIITEEDKKRITFFGKFTPKDIPQITNEVDINVLPSLCADTAPQTIFESFSNGLSIIAPNVGGFPDFITDGKNGLIYEKASVKGLSECLAQIIQNPELISEFNRNIPKCKTMKENVDELLELYASV
jgi:glycosyltransferase involved in cell wall biosynthesis